MIITAVFIIIFTFIYVYFLSDKLSSVIPPVPSEHGDCGLNAGCIGDVYTLEHPLAGFLIFILPALISYALACFLVSFFNPVKKQKKSSSRKSKK